MKNDNIIQEKSYSFALKIIEVYKYLYYEKKEYVLARQILRSGTSIGANVEEAIGGISRKDFLSELSIAYKEARETKYWVNLLYDSKFILITQKQNLLPDCEELLRILGSIQKTMKKKED